MEQYLTWIKLITDPTVVIMGSGGILLIVLALIFFTSKAHTENHDYRDATGHDDD